MSSNPEYDDLRKCYAENKYWIDKAHEIWEKNPDPFNKERQYCLQKRSEVLDYVKETYGLNVKELKTRVQELSQQREQQSLYHVAEPQKFNRYFQNTDSHELLEREEQYKPQKELHGTDRYKQRMEQQKHHEREQHPPRDHDFTREKER